MYKVKAENGAKPPCKVNEITEAGWYWWVPTNGRPRFVELQQDMIEWGIPDVPAYAGTYTGPIEPPDVS